MLSLLCSDTRPRFGIGVLVSNPCTVLLEGGKLTDLGLFRGILLLLRRCWDPGSSSFLLGCFYCFCFETGFYYEAQAVLKLTAVLLPQDPTCLAYRCELACPAPLAFLLP